MGGGRLGIGRQLGEAAEEGVLESRAEQHRGGRFAVGVRPDAAALLTGRPGRGRYRRMIDHNVGMSIARADVADAILAVLADPATIGHVVGVGY